MGLEDSRDVVHRKRAAIEPAPRRQALGRGQRQEAHHIGDRRPKAVNEMHIGLLAAGLYCHKGNARPICPMSKLTLVVIESADGTSGLSIPEMFRDGI